MSRLNVLISHAHDEKGLAAAWKEVLETTSSGAIDTWFSSDTQASGGMVIGGEWRGHLYGKLATSDFILAIQTPTSAGRPWIMWECAAASGIDKVRGIIPVVYSMGSGDLANPLTSYQVYVGEDPDRVREICERLAREAGLTPPAAIYAEPIKVYLDAVALHRPRKALGVEQMALWRNRFEELIRSGRSGEVGPQRQLMYTSLGKPFRPLEPTIHELLSRILLDQRDFRAAIEEADHALSLLEDDVQLLHRKALALTELQELESARQLVERIIALNEELRLNPEIASLLGRISRERWSVSGKVEDLDEAIAAYYRAYDADRTQYYPGINAAELALRRGDVARAEQIFHEVLDTCAQLQQRPVVSFWVDFTAGSAHLGFGDVEAALAEYQKGISRLPSPSLRERDSAAKGVRRMVAAKELPDEVAERITAVLA
jgi:tetratricopeptide (TPR) repeat protein